MNIRFDSGLGAPAPDPALEVAKMRTAAAALTHTRFREGYDVAEVDAVLIQAAVALDEQHRGEPLSLTAETVLNVKFAATKFRDGYDQDEVDDLLDRVVASLRIASPVLQRQPAANPTPALDRLQAQGASGAHPRALRATVRTVAVVCWLGLAITVTAVVTYPRDASVHRLALQLRDHGEPAGVTHVDLHPNSRSSGSVDITFVAEGATTTAELAGASADSASSDPADYHVKYLPTDPTQVMSEKDIPYDVDDVLSESRGALLLGLVPTALLAAAWLARRRPAWWIWL